MFEREKEKTISAHADGGPCSLSLHVLYTVARPTLTRAEIFQHICLRSFFIDLKTAEN